MDFICLERVMMILNELFDLNCVEVYIPDVYNVLWDSFIQSPNIMVKAMAFKFLSHLECNWSLFVSEPLKKSKPKRMSLKILNRLKSMFDKLYFLEKRSENEHFSLLLNITSQFLYELIGWKLLEIKKKKRKKRKKRKQIEYR